MITSPPAKPAHFQFSLLHLLLLTTAACLLFTIDRLIGTLPTSLLFGTIAVFVVVSALHLENPLLGGLFGVLLSLVILLVASVCCQYFGESFPAWALPFAMIIYPMIGHTIGYTCTALNTLSEEKNTISCCPKTRRN